MTHPHESYWPILKDAVSRDPELEALLGGLGRWLTPDEVEESTPSGHGSDRGLYVTLGNTTLLLMENDPKEHYDHLPTVDNYCIQVARADDDGGMEDLRIVKLEGGMFSVQYQREEQASRTIVIHLDGGLVQAIHSAEPLRVIVADHDIEGNTEDKALDSPEGGRAFLREEEANVDPELVNSYIAALEPPR